MSENGNHTTFYDYIIGDEDSKEYDKTLPFGGIRKDAPEKIKADFEDFVIECGECERRLISAGEAPDEAKRLIKKHNDWMKERMVKKCNHAWRNRKIK